jgi:hypothetical protein
VRARLDSGARDSQRRVIHRATLDRSPTFRGRRLTATTRRPAPGAAAASRTLREAAELLARPQAGPLELDCYVEGCLLRTLCEQKRRRRVL